MLTHNYWNLKGYADATPFPSDSNISVNLGLVDLVGNTFVTQVRSSSRSDIDVEAGSPAQFSIKANTTVLVGSSGSEPTASDFKIGKDETGNFSNLNISMNSAADGDSTKTIYTVSGVNSSENEIVLREIGIVKSLMFQDGYAMSPAYAKTILLAHELLKNPVTVAAGASFSLTIEWTES